MGYTEFQISPGSAKVGLCILRAAERIVGWSIFSGNIYQAPYSRDVLDSINVDGVGLTEVATFNEVGAGTYFFDRTQSLVYAHLSDNSDPDSSFVVADFRLFFASSQITLAHDLSTGYEVDWLALFQPDSDFEVQIENTKNLLGVALTSGATLNFHNDQSFWGPIFDKLTFETKIVEVYSTARSLAPSEAQLIYKGRIVGRRYSASRVSFGAADVLDELRAPVELEDLSAHPTAIIAPSFSTAKQRRLYGTVKGHVLTPIDQVTPTGYTLTGSVSATPGSATVTGSGSSFLAEVTPGDQLQIGSNLNRFRVETVASDTSLTLSSSFSGNSEVDVAFKVIPVHNKRYANRKFLVAEHALARPSATISSVIDAATFFVSDSSFLFEGDVIEVSGEQGEVRILGDGFIKLLNALPSTPTVGDTLYKASVGNLFLEDEELTLTDDFTYDAASAIVTLTDVAEFNIARQSALTGLITVTNGSRSITGSGTIFRTELSSGDWLKIGSGSTWFEVLEVVDDEEATVRTTPGAPDAGSGVAGVRKNPKVIDDRSKVACDALGKADGSGNLIQLPGAIAQDLLSDAGLSALALPSSFTTVDELIPLRIGFAIPDQMQAKTVPSVREALNLICRSTFTVVFVNRDFQLEMRQVGPEYETLNTLEKEDVLEMDVAFDSNDVVGRVRVIYSEKEYDSSAAEGSNVAEVSTNAGYLQSTEKEFELSTALVDSEDAEIMASRWAFLLDRASVELRLQTKLQAATWQIGDIVLLDHPKLFQRFGSSSTERLGIITGITKSALGVEFVLNDLGNTLSRVARIAASGSADFSNASDTEKVKNGFITDADGFTNGIHGLNLIW